MGDRLVRKHPDHDTIATLTGEVRELRLANQRLIEGNGRLKDALRAAGVPFHLVVAIYLGLGGS